MVAPLDARGNLIASLQQGGGGGGGGAAASAGSLRALVEGGRRTGVGMAVTMSNGGGSRHGAQHLGDMVREIERSG